VVEPRQRRLAVVVLSVFTLVAVEQAEAQSAPEREGFTILVNLGLGIQHDAAIEETAVGLAGANLGVGGFLTENLALMFRFSGTNVTYDFGSGGEFSQVSGTAAPAIQYWFNRFNVEAGGGMGFWSSGGEDEQGFGLILGAGVAIFNRGKHNLQVGVEYAPAFTDSGTVQNIGFTFGYQFL